MRIPKILAPAGDWESFIAAVENGADAVYLGGKTFNAVLLQEILTMIKCKRLLSMPHLRRVCIYVTVNIVVDNSELQDAVKYVKKLYDWGVDGIIVQDLG